MIIYIANTIRVDSYLQDDGENICRGFVKFHFYEENLISQDSFQKLQLIPKSSISKYVCALYKWHRQTSFTCAVDLSV